MRPVVKLLLRAGRGAHEALVVAEVEVGFGAVGGDEHFAVLERAHRARIDVDVRIQLHHADLEAARFEDGAQRGRGDALAQARKRHRRSHRYNASS